MQVPAGHSLQSLLLALLELLLEVRTCLVGRYLPLSCVRSDKFLPSVPARSAPQASMELASHNGFCLAYSSGILICRPTTVQTEETRQSEIQKPSHCSFISFARPTQASSPGASAPGSPLQPGTCQTCQPVTGVAWLSTIAFRLLLHDNCSMLSTWAGNSCLLRTLQMLSPSVCDRYKGGITMMDIYAIAEERAAFPAIQPAHSCCCLAYYAYQQGVLTRCFPQVWNEWHFD